MTALLYCATRALCRAGAVLAGAGHYAGSARGLREEGIDPRVRLKAVPMAVSPVAETVPAPSAAAVSIAAVGEAPGTLLPAALGQALSLDGGPPPARLELLLPAVLREEAVLPVFRWALRSILPVA